MKLFTVDSFKINPNQQRKNTSFGSSLKTNLEFVRRIASDSRLIFSVDADKSEPSVRGIAIRLGRVVDKASMEARGNADLLEALINARAAVNSLKGKLGIPVPASTKN
jgi:hypothetical protein